MISPSNLPLTSNASDAEMPVSGSGFHAPLANGTMKATTPDAQTIIDALTPLLTLLLGWLISRRRSPNSPT